MSSKRGNSRIPPRGPVLAWQDGMRAATGMRRLRLEADLTQEALGSLTGHSQQGIGQREQGAVRMTRGEAGLIAKALGTDLEGLLAAGWNPAESAVVKSKRTEGLRLGAEARQLRAVERAAKFGRLRERGVSVREAANQVGVSVEHARKYEQRRRQALAESAEAA